MKIFAGAAAALLLSTCLSAGAIAADTVADQVKTAAAYPGRPPLDRDRDAARKPADVLAFAEIAPAAKVADLVPGDGYYTRILSHLVGPAGHVYSFVPMAGGPQQERAAQREFIKQGKEPPPLPVDPILEIQNVWEYSGNVTAIWESLSGYGGEFALPEQMDAVFSAGGYHYLHGKAFPKLDMGAVNKAIFRAMVPGGVYVVNDNAAAKGAGFGGAESLQRSDADAVKAEVTAAGFVLDGENNFLANPGDDHTRPVSDPALGDKADQFLLRFKKPVNAPITDKRPPATTMSNYYGNTYIYLLGIQNERHHFYYPNGSYQEFGNTGTMLQEGYWFWDVDGHNCQLHQYPAAERAVTICHAFTARELNVKGTQDNGGGPQPTEIIPGYHALPH